MKHIKVYIYFNLLLVLLVDLFLTVQCTYSQIKEPKVSLITFSGNEYFSNSQLQNFGVLKTGVPFSQEQFELDMKNLIRNYQNEGFLECSIVSTEKEYNFDSSTVTLSVKLSEGKQTLIGEIRLEGNKAISTKKLTGGLFTKPGKALDSRTLNQDISEILTLYENKGFPFVSVIVRDIEQYTDGGKNKLRLIIRIQENEKVRIDKVVVEGNTSTKEDVIVREIRLNKNGTITKDGLSDIRQRLENIGYFETVDMPKILKYKNSTVLLIKVTEGNTNTFDGILGYVPPNANEDKGYLTGLVNLSLRNLFGTGRKVSARFSKEVRTTQELELGYSEPWILGLPINCDIGFLQRINDTIFVKRSLNFKAEALVSRYFSVSALGGLERVIPTFTGSQTLYSVFDSRLVYTGAEIKFDNRDYIYNPSRGILYRTGYSIGQKKIYNAASFTGQNVPADFTVQKFTVDADFYYSFFRRQSTLLGVHGGEITSPRLENADYFRFGGPANVRGYRLNQFLASKIVWSNIEFRYSLTRKTFASLFYDMGYYVRSEDNLIKAPEEKQFIYGYGIGIRIETGMGIFGVSYALGKGDSFLEGKVHFGLINNF